MYLKIRILGLRMIIVRSIKRSRSHGCSWARLILYCYGVRRCCLHGRQDERLMYLFSEFGASICHFLCLKRYINQCFFISFSLDENGTTAFKEKNLRKILRVRKKLNFEILGALNFSVHKILWFKSNCLINPSSSLSSNLNFYRHFNQCVFWVFE